MKISFAGSSFLGTLAVLLFILAGCGKSKPDSPVTPPPSSGTTATFSISPSKGPGGTYDTLTGSGFSTVPAENTVRFNHYDAQVISASATQLVVVVPFYGISGDVVVIVNEKDTLTGPAFTYTGAVSTLAGTAGTAGYQDGSGSAARFNYPYAIVYGPDGMIYVGDQSSIRKITPAGVVTTFAGSGVPGYKDGKGADAQFTNIMGLAFDSHSNLYVSDNYNNSIRKVSPDGTVTTFAGSIYGGFQDGVGMAARFKSPSGIAIDAGDNVFVADADNDAIRRITPVGAVTTLAGKGFDDTTNGKGTAAGFRGPAGLAFDKSGILYVSDEFNHDIRAITPEGTVSVFAGHPTEAPGIYDGVGSAAVFQGSTGIAFGSDGNLYVTDDFSGIRRVTPGALVTTIINPKGTDGAQDGSFQVATFNRPYSIAADGQGNLYVADTENNTIRKITL